MDEQSLFERWRQERRADIQREVRIKCQHVPFGQRMRTIRSILGMTQKQLASVLDINARTVIRYERASDASIRVMPELISAGFVFHIVIVFAWLPPHRDSPATHPPAVCPSDSR